MQDNFLRWCLRGWQHVDGIDSARRGKVHSKETPRWPFTAPVLLHLFETVLSFCFTFFYFLLSHLPAPCWCWLLSSIQWFLGVLQDQELQAFPFPELIKAPLWVNKDVLSPLYYISTSRWASLSSLTLRSSIHYKIESIGWKSRSFTHFSPAVESLSYVIQWHKTSSFDSLEVLWT